MGRPSKLQPDDRLFERVAEGESLRRVAPDYGVDASNLSRFFNGAGAGELAAARQRAAQSGTAALPMQPPTSAGYGEAAFLDRRDAEREARLGRAPGQPRNSLRGFKIRFGGLRRSVSLVLTLV